MKYVDEYRDGALAQTIAAAIRREADPAREYHFMEFCGGHTHAISRYGLEDLLPANVKMIHGPGCPVCVLPVARIDMAIACARRPEVTLCVYGDLMRVPGSGGMSLMKAKAEGADIRMVYSTLDALRIAEKIAGARGRLPRRRLRDDDAADRAGDPRRGEEGPDELLHPLQPRADAGGDPDHPAEPRRARARQRQDRRIHRPGACLDRHRPQPYRFFAEEFEKPVVVAGFEPLDVAQAILMLVRQVNDGRHEVENQYIRAVSEYGNEKAQAEVAEVFELRERFEWRGLGDVPYGALKLRAGYERFDAERRFDLAEKPAHDNPACECGAILRGVKKPRDCKLFGTLCTPDTPMGSCMVSPEGACSAHWTYGRFREAQSARRRAREEVA